MPQPSRRIVITGLGPITAFGVGIQPLWSALCEGRSAIKRIARFDPSGFPCQLGAELPDDAFDVRSVVPKSYRKATKVMARDIEMAVGAAAAAVADAKLITKAVDPEKAPTIAPARFGCQIGAGLIAADVDELTAALVTSRAANDDSGHSESTSSNAVGVLNRQSSIINRQCPIDLVHWGATGMQNLTPLWLLKYLPNMLACHVTIIHDCQGPSNTITCAEASCGLSIGESMRVIQRGAADACLSGGAEAKINPMGLLRQIFARRLAETNGDVDPATIVKPFDSNARGSVLGEGGGIIVLEGLDVAHGRGAPMYAEVAGFAASQSHCPDTVGLEIDESGSEISDAIDGALESAGIKPEQIDAIVPLGSGIAALDRAEAGAIRRSFGHRSKDIPIITTMPNTGNCCAGAGAISVVAAAMALHSQTLPARMNTRGGLGLNAGAGPARSATLNHMLVTSSGLGGQNAAIVLKKAGSP